MPLALSIFIISAASIGYELLLMRLYSIVLWHHFAYMIISVALLGYSASGAYLAIFHSRIASHFASLYVINAALFGLFSVAGFVMAQSVSFNPLEIIWDMGQQLRLLLIYLSLFLPFFFAANCVGLALVKQKEKITQIYFYNLIGAGAGALSVIAMLFWFSPSRCLAIIGATGFLGAGIACLDIRLRGLKRLAPVLAMLAVVSLFIWPEQWIKPRVSQYKGLKQALLAPGSKIVYENSSPLGLITVVESLQIPFRYAPGLSLNSPSEPPAQLAMFIDGDSMSAIAKNKDGKEGLESFDYLTAALPYHLLEQPSVLVLGAGGGSGVLMARYLGASSIDAVELNRQVLDLTRRIFAGYAGNIYDEKNVRSHIADSRGYVTKSGKKFDLIQVALLDSFSASAAGVGALSESYHYTVEAFEEYLRKLNPGGYLAITRWLKLPPRDSLKLFATAIVAINNSGKSEPARRLALIRSWNTVTMLIKNGEFSESEINSIHRFVRKRSFDVSYYPGLSRLEANVANTLDEPYLFDGAAALLGANSESFIDRYKFQIAPSTDNHPYFFHFFRWSSLPEFLAKGKKGGFALLEHGYLALVMTLIQTALICAIFVLLLFIILRGKSRAGMGLGGVGLYFMSLGFGFMFIEIIFMQKFILFLGAPLYAAATSLSAFLVFAGIGSGLSPILARSRLLKTRSGAIRTATVLIFLIVIFYNASLPFLFDWLVKASDIVKIAVSVIVIAPLGFLMGIPFPLGLTIVAYRAADLVAWAWGINGAASVLGAILATVLSIHFGFTMVLVAAGLFYAAAPLFLPEDRK